MLIKVDPEVLISSSSKFSEITSSLENSSNLLRNSANSAPSYDLQFQPAVAIMALESKVRIEVINSRLTALSHRLALIANAFLSADNDSLTGLWSISMGLDKYLSEFALIKRFSEYINLHSLIMGKTLNIGRLGSASIFGFSIFISYITKVYSPGKEDQSESTDKSKNGNSDSENKTTKQGLSTNAADSQITMSSSIDYSGIAEKVKTGLPDTTESGYPRNGYGGVQSDCTWYAAQAVHEASNGKVEIANLGNATQWVENAENQGYLVDNIPEAGSVIHFDFGHVGFIEKVENINGRLIVTWSEEQAIGGRPDDDWSKVTQIGDQLRWRVTTDLTDYFKNSRANCIHVDY